MSEQDSLLSVGQTERQTQSAHAEVQRRYPIIVILVMDGDIVRGGRIVAEALKHLPNGAYIAHGRTWAGGTNAAVVELLGSDLFPDVLTDSYRQAVLEQANSMPSIHLLPLPKGDATVDISPLTMMADEVICIHPSGRIFEEIRSKTGQEIHHLSALRDEELGVQLSTIIRDKTEGVDWQKCSADLLQSYSVIDISTLAAHLDLPLIGGDHSRREWSLTGVQRAISHLWTEHQNDKPLLIFGACPAFVAAAIACAFPSRQISIFDPKIQAPVPLAGVDVPPTAPSPLSVTLEVRDFCDGSNVHPHAGLQAGYQLLHCTMPEMIDFRDPSSLSRIKLPELDPRMPVVISGALPIIVFAYLSRHLRRQGYDVGIFTPHMRKDAGMISPAMVIGDRDINYIDILPFYREVFPIDALRRTIELAKTELAIQGQDSVFDSLRSLLDARATALKSVEAIPREFDASFRHYAAFAQTARDTLTGLGTALREHSVTERDAAKTYVQEAFRVLTLDPFAPETIQSIQSTNAELKAFGIIIKQCITLTNRRLRLDQVPGVGISKLHLQATADPTQDPHNMFDTPDSPMVYDRMIELYKHNYADDPGHRERLLQNLPQYMDPRLNPTVHILGFHLDRAPSSKISDDMKGSARVTNIHDTENPASLYRYIGGLNIDSHFQGFNIYLPFIAHLMHDEFQSTGAIGMVFCAAPRVAAVYRRTLNATPTEQVFSPEFASGDESQLLLLTREAFYQHHPEYHQNSQ